MCGGNAGPFLTKLDTYNRNACPFLTKLVTYNRCVVALNGHLMIRNGLTIGVWWKCKSISDQIGHLQ